MFFLYIYQSINLLLLLDNKSATASRIRSLLWLMLLRLDKLCVDGPERGMKIFFLNTDDNV